MSITKQKLVYFFWAFLFALGAVLIFIPVSESISKKILGIYLVIGALLSYKYHVPLFKRDMIDVDKEDGYNDGTKYTNLVVLAFGIFLILF